MPRLNGSRSTRAPAPRAARVVPSAEPSTTTMSRPGSNAHSSAITLPIVCSSFSAGTIATRRSSRRRGSGDGGAAVASGSDTVLRVPSQDDAHGPPPGRDERVREARRVRELEHLWVEHGRQMPSEVAVGDPAQRLGRTPPLAEPARVRGEPPPAGDLLAQPALPPREEGDAELGGEEHRREQQQKPSRVCRQHEDEPIPLEVVLLAPAAALEDVFVQDVGVGRDNHAQAVQAHAPAELEILLVEEELLREAA